MTETPGMLLWTDRYLADTFDLSTTQHGAYLLILMAMWRNGGSLPNDEERLAAYAKLRLDKWRKIAPRMMEFFIVNGDGTLTQKRLSIELQKTNEKHASYVERGRAGGNAKATKIHSQAPGMKPNPLKYNGAAVAGLAANHRPMQAETRVSPISLKHNETDLAGLAADETGSPDFASLGVQHRQFQESSFDAKPLKHNETDLAGLAASSSTKTKTKIYPFSDSLFISPLRAHAHAYAREGPEQQPPPQQKIVKTCLEEFARPDPQQLTDAELAGLSDGQTETEWIKFRDHNVAHGTLAANWRAMWRLWIANIPRFQARAGPVDVIEAMRRFRERHAHDEDDCNDNGQTSTGLFDGLAAVLQQPNDRHRNQTRSVLDRAEGLAT